MRDANELAKRTAGQELETWEPDGGNEPASPNEVEWDRWIDASADTPDSGVKGSRRLQLARCDQAAPTTAARPAEYR
jgi:hypothetical protein